MITVIILDNGEPSVLRLTYENLYHELKDIKGSEIWVEKNWFSALKKVKTSFVCLVEADCLVSPGYFGIQLKALIKNPQRRISMLTAATGINKWDNCIYGYSISRSMNNTVVPIRTKKSRAQYTVQVGYIPGAIIRLNMLLEAVEAIKLHPSWKNDLVFLSTQLSFAFWRQHQGDKNQGNEVHINPNVTYVTTEDYVNDIADFEVDISDLLNKFVTESI